MMLQTLKKLGFTPLLIAQSILVSLDAFLREELKHQTDVEDALKEFITYKTAEFYSTKVVTWQKCFACNDTLMNNISVLLKYILSNFMLQNVAYVLRYLMILIQHACDEVLLSCNKLIRPNYLCMYVCIVLSTSHILSLSIFILLFKLY